MNKLILNYSPEDKAIPEPRYLNLYCNRGYVFGSSMSTLAAADGARVTGSRDHKDLAGIIVKVECDRNGDFIFTTVKEYP